MNDFPETQLPVNLDPKDRPAAVTTRMEGVARTFKDKADIFAQLPKIDGNSKDALVEHYNWWSQHANEIAKANKQGGPERTSFKMHSALKDQAQTKENIQRPFSLTEETRKTILKKDKEGNYFQTKKVVDKKADGVADLMTKHADEFGFAKNQKLTNAAFLNGLDLFAYRNMGSVDKEIANASYKEENSTNGWAPGIRLIAKNLKKENLPVEDQETYLFVAALSGYLKGYFCFRNGMVSISELRGEDYKKTLERYKPLVKDMVDWIGYPNNQNIKDSYQYDQISLD